MARSSLKSNYYYDKAAGMWHSTITRSGETVSLGYFDSEEEARKIFLWCRWILENVTIQNETP